MSGWLSYLNPLSYFGAKPAQAAAGAEPATSAAQQQQQQPTGPLVTSVLDLNPELAQADVKTISWDYITQIIRQYVKTSGPTATSDDTMFFYAYFVYQLVVVMSRLNALIYYAKNTRNIVMDDVFQHLPVDSTQDVQSLITILLRHLGTILNTIFITTGSADADVKMKEFLSRLFPLLSRVPPLSTAELNPQKPDTYAYTYDNPLDIFFKIATEEVPKKMVGDSTAIKKYYATLVNSLQLDIWRLFMYNDNLCVLFFTTIADDKTPHVSLKSIKNPENVNIEVIQRMMCYNIVYRDYTDEHLKKINKKYDADIYDRPVIEESPGMYTRNKDNKVGVHQILSGGVPTGLRFTSSPLFYMIFRLKFISVTKDSPKYVLIDTFLLNYITEVYLETNAFIPKAKRPDNTTYEDIMKLIVKDTRIVHCNNMRLYSYVNPIVYNDADLAESMGLLHVNHAKTQTVLTDIRDVMYQSYTDYDSCDDPILASNQYLHCVLNPPNYPWNAGAATFGKLLLFNPEEQTQKQRQPSTQSPAAAQLTVALTQAQPVVVVPTAAETAFGQRLLFNPEEQTQEQRQPSPQPAVTPTAIPPVVDVPTASPAASASPNVSLMVKDPTVSADMQQLSQPFRLATAFLIYNSSYVLDRYFRPISFPNDMCEEDSVILRVGKRIPHCLFAEMNDPAKLAQLESYFNIAAGSGVNFDLRNNVKFIRTSTSHPAISDLVELLPGNIYYENSIKSPIRCGKCKRSFKAENMPTRLSCSHLICKKCASKIEAPRMCPTCMAAITMDVEIKLSEAAVAERYKTDFFINPIYFTLLEDCAPSSVKAMVQVSPDSKVSVLTFSDSIVKELHRIGNVEYGKDLGIQGSKKRRERYAEARRRLYSILLEMEKIRGDMVIDLIKKFTSGGDLPATEQTPEKLNKKIAMRSVCYIEYLILCNKDFFETFI